MQGGHLRKLGTGPPGPTGGPRGQYLAPWQHLTTPEYADADYIRQSAMNSAFARYHQRWIFVPGDAGRLQINLSEECLATRLLQLR